jgi:RNA polymerase sigma-54 factor
MALELRQQVKLSQQLVMTPQLQQAIKLLQLGRLELAETIQQEIEQNPVLEEEVGTDSEVETAETARAGDAEPEIREIEKTAEVRLEESSNSLSEINWEDYANEYESGYSSHSGNGREDGDLPSRLDILTRKPDLQAHLRWQLSFANLSDAENEIGLFIIGNLNRNGFLDADEEDIVRGTGADAETVARVLTVVQDLDPAGIAARDVKESLLLQLEKLGLGDSLAAIIVRGHIHSLETKNYGAIVKATGQAIDKVVAAIKVIINLNPYPGRIYSDEEPHYIVPDVYVHKLGDEYVILLNDEGLPRLRLNSYYKDILKDSSTAPAAAREYIQDKLKSAVWLIKSIQQRQRTIYRVVESIVKFQRPFLENGIQHLRPLVLRDVAEDIGMHESTISRVTSNKYVHTPQGTFELKYFFNSAISQLGGDDLSSESIKNRLRQIIQAEDPEKPLSDKFIARIFENDSIVLARRTVAKYREQMGILPSKYRKKPKF